MEVCGSIRGYGWQWANWEELELKFTLPDGKVLELEGPLEIETLSPVTELLQESARQSMQEAEHMPEIDNFYTAVYFLHALEFADASDKESHGSVWLHSWLRLAVGKLERVRTQVHLT